MRKWIVALNKIINENEEEIELEDNIIEAEWIAMTNDSLIFYIWSDDTHTASCIKHIHAPETWREVILIEEEENGKD
jgi:hypothetical protein